MTSTYGRKCKKQEKHLKCQTVGGKVCRGKGYASTQNYSYFILYQTITIYASISVLHVDLSMQPFSGAPRTLFYSHYGNIEHVAKASQLLILSHIYIGNLKWNTRPLYMKWSEMVLNQFIAVAFSLLVFACSPSACGVFVVCSLLHPSPNPSHDSCWDGIQWHWLKGWSSKEGGWMDG